MSPAVSILVPSFNDGRFLEENLRSVAAQTWRDFEAIVADDASSDDCPEIAARWAGADPRFRLTRAPKNLGMNPNWNRALREARGEFVLKLDADDVMAPDCLEALLEEFSRVEGLLFAACRTLDCDEALQVVGPFLGDEGLRRHGLDPERRHVRSGLQWLRMCFDGIQLWTSDALLFRRSDLLQLGGWDDSWIAADTDLIVRALALDRPVAHIPLPGILYRRRPGSMSERQRRSGDASLETSLIMLGALRQQAARLRPWGRPLRQSWWRLWHHIRHADASSPPPEGAGESRAELVDRLREARRRLAPPLAVRAEGWLRFLAWNLRARLRRKKVDPGAPS